MPETEETIYEKETCIYVGAVHDSGYDAYGMRRDR